MAVRDALGATGVRGSHEERLAAVVSAVAAAEEQGGRDGRAFLRGVVPTGIVHDFYKGIVEEAEIELLDLDDILAEAGSKALSALQA